MIVRAKQSQIVANPETGGMVTVSPKTAYDSNDAIVQAHPWLFAADSGEQIERATRRPGERRLVRRGKKSDATPEPTAEPEGDEADSSDEE